MSYQETAYEVMKLFLTDFTEEELKTCIAGAYDKKFDTDVIAPLAKVEGAYYLELFHGATIAFKDKMCIRDSFKAMRKLAAEHPSEQVGKEIRKLYSWNGEGKLLDN